MSVVLSTTLDYYNRDVGYCISTINGIGKKGNWSVVIFDIWSFSSYAGGIFDGLLSNVCFHLLSIKVYISFTNRYDYAIRWCLLNVDT